MVRIITLVFFMATPSMMALSSLKVHYCSVRWLTSFLVDGQPLMTYLFRFCRCLSPWYISCISLTDMCISMSVGAVTVSILTFISLIFHPYFLHRSASISSLLCMDQVQVCILCIFCAVVFKPNGL